MKISLRSLRVVAFTFAVVPAAAFAAGCSGATSEQPHTSASAMSKAPVAEGTHGPVRFVGSALGEVALRPEQRAKLETILKDAETRHASGLGARTELMTALADQVERGSIDRAALAPKIEAVRAGALQVRPQDLAALDEVHAVLDKEQRAAFVDALESKFKEGFRHGHKGRHGKQGEAKGDHAGMAGPWHLKQLAEDLKLTDAQKDSIKEKLHALHEAEGKEKDKEGKHDRRGGFARMRQAKQALESFKNDDFKAQSLAALAPPADGSRAEHMLKAAEAVLPVLTPEQRKIAADRLRAFAARGEVPEAR